MIAMNKKQKYVAEIVLVSVVLFFSNFSNCFAVTKGQGQINLSSTTISKIIGPVLTDESDTVRISAGDATYTTATKSNSNPQMPEDLEFIVGIDPVLYQTWLQSYEVEFHWQFMVEYFAEAPNNTTKARHGIKLIDGRRDGFLISAETLPTFNLDFEARDWFALNTDYEIGGESDLKVKNDYTFHLKRDCNGAENCHQWKDNEFGGGFLYAAVRILVKDKNNQQIVVDRYLTWGVGNCSNKQCPYPEDYASRQKLLGPRSIPNQTILDYIENYVNNSGVYTPSAATFDISLPQVVEAMQGIAYRETQYGVYRGDQAGAGNEWMVRGMPTVASNGDGGYGLMQGTAPAPEYEEIWDWKKNVAYALRDVFIEKMENARDALHANGHTPAANDTNEVMREALARYNGPNYHSYRQRSQYIIDSNLNLVYEKVLLSSAEFPHTNNVPTWGVYFPTPDYYRDLLFCRHRGTATLPQIDVSRSQGADLPYTDLTNVGQNKLEAPKDGNQGFNVNLTTGQAGDLIYSATCYADRRAKPPSYNLPGEGASVPVFAPNNPMLPAGEINADGIVNPVIPTP